MADAFVPNREELSWCAGFFDGEGHISFRFRENGGGTGKRWRRIGVQITQVDREVLDRFHRAVGGVGRVNGPYLPKSCIGTNKQPHYKYSTGGFPHSQAVIAFLWPFLSSIKREQGRACIAAFIQGDVSVG